MRYAILALAALPLAGCSMLGFGRPSIDRVEKRDVYVVAPDSLYDCPEKSTFLPTQEERAKIDTETEYGKQFVLPLYQAYGRCYDASEARKAYDEKQKAKNAK